MFGQIIKILFYSTMALVREEKVLSLLLQQSKHSCLHSLYELKLQGLLQEMICWRHYFPSWPI